MRINRSLGEVVSKLSPKTLIEVARLARDSKNPFHELQVFLGVKELPEHAVISLRSGYNIPVATIHDFQQTFWDCWVRRSYRVLSTDKVIVDVGANIGCFSIYALARSPGAKVYAVEPSTQNFKRLEDLIALNKVEGQITPFSVGVARTSGELSLNVGVESAYHTSFGPAAVGVKNEKIRVLSLKDLFDLLKIDGQIDLLKMDCEGAEMDCLFGANQETLSRVKRLELEYHEWAGFSFEELREHLLKSGLRLLTRSHNSKDRNGNACFILMRHIN